MRKAINNEKIEGRVYQHNLTIKTVQNQTSAKQQVLEIKIKHMQI